MYFDNTKKKLKLGNFSGQYSKISENPSELQKWVKSQNGRCRVSEVAQLQNIFFGKTLSMGYNVCQML